MKTKRKYLFIALAVVIALGAFGLQQVLALTPGMYLVDGATTNCQNLYQATVISGPVGHTGLSELGPLFGIKYDGNPTGDLTHTLTEGDGWVLTGGVLPDPNNSVSIFNVILNGAEGVQFDWSATLGIDAVIVKAQGANAYVYTPEQFGAAGLVAPDGKAISHVEFCYDYSLAATKTANTSYTRTYTWDIDKSVAPDTQTGFAGETFSSDYDVIVDRIETDSAFAVSGEIVVSNPTPYTVAFSVSDVVGSTPATVTCPSYSLAPLASVTCTYTAPLAAKLDGTNVATITSTTSQVKGATASAGYVFGEPTTVVGYPSVNVSDSLQGALGAVGGDATIEYTRQFTCPTDLTLYVDGFYSFQVPNTATIDETGLYDNASVTINCYVPSISKTADGSYDIHHDWSVVKTVDPLSQSAFAGETVPFTWHIAVSDAVTYDDYAIEGTITITNPNPEDTLTVTLSDVLDDGTPVTLACGGSLVVPPAGSATCDYTAAPADATAKLNTASFTLNTVTYSDDATVVWDPNVIDGTAVLDDPYLGIIGQAVSDGWTGSYEGSYTCSSAVDGTDYVDGQDLDNQVSNTANVTGSSGDTGSSTATTVINCYAPSISKTAAGTYDIHHDWSVVKTYSPSDLSGFAGGTVPFTWHIAVSDAITYDDYAISGTITVTNPNPVDGLTVTLSDVLDDGTPVTLACGGSLVVPPAGSATCSYTAAPDDASATANTASFSLNDILYSAVETVGWTFNEYNETAVLDDLHLDINDQVVTDGWSGNFADSYTCSGDIAGDYDGNGTDLDNEVSNTAVVNGNDGDTGSDTETALIDCYAPLVSKTAAGSYTERHTWDVEKTVDIAAQAAFAGAEAPFTWTVTVTESVANEAILVTGTISVVNPAPMEMVVSLADVLDDGTFPTVTCSVGSLVGDQLTIPATTTAECAYTASPLDVTATQNEVKATLNGIEYAAVAPFTWDVTVIDDEVELDDDQNPALPQFISEGGVFTYTDKYECSHNPDDYNGVVKGQYIYDEKNLAFLTGESGKLDESEASTQVTCYAPLVSKDASALYYKDIDWTIAKSVTPLDASKFLGESADFDYTVTLTKNETFGPYVVSGKITVTNPAPMDMTVSVIELTPGAVVDCGPSLTIPAGQTAECGYTLNLDGAVDGTNTAAATLNGIDFTATAPYVFGEPLPAEGSEPEMITVGDSLKGSLGTFTASGSAIYTIPQTCSSDPSMYAGDGTYSVSFPNTAAINETTGDSDSETVTLNCFAPVVSKTAEALYTRTYTWEIDKQVDLDSHAGAPGDQFMSNYTVFVDQTAVESDFSAAGVISVFNPASAPGPMTVAIADAVDGIPVVLDCGGSLIVDPGLTGTCGYTVGLPAKIDGLNIATVTFNTANFLATAPVTFGDPTTVVGYPTVNVTDSFGGPLGSASGDQSFTYSRDFACSTNPGDYTDGVDTDNYPNTATITETGQNDNEDVTVTCTLPALTATKTAAGSYDRTVTWELTKTVDDDSHSGFAGETAGASLWTVTATKTEAESNFVVSGTITITNPAAIAQTFEVMDELDDGTGVMVNCPKTTIEPDEAVICTYSVGVENRLAEFNFATVAAPGNPPIMVGDPIEWTETLIGYDSGTLSDERFGYSQVISATTEVTFPETFACSSDPADYGTTGSYSYTVTNTAILNGNINLTASDDVTVDCTLPKLTFSKTALGSYTKTYEWFITKDVVPPTSQAGVPGQVLSWTWTVTVTNQVTESGFAVAGEIIVTNPSAIPQTFTPVDTLNDGTVMDVTCPKYTLEPGENVTCTYGKSLAGHAATDNSVTLIAAGNTYSTVTVPIVWTPNVVNGTATVTDTEIGLNETVSGAGPFTWSATDSHKCSTTKSDYDATTGRYGAEVENTATLKYGDTTKTAWAKTGYMCKAVFIDLKKLTNGVVDPTKTWNFALYNGPDGFGTTPLATGTTQGDADGLLELGNLTLSPQSAYTVCELGVAGGWTSHWLLNGATVNPYNPNANDNPPEDLGNRCVDITPKMWADLTTHFIHFEVNNAYPGGDPRTPGYWKNWNTCTGGGQANAAAANGGWQNGFWLLDDVLNPNVGGGIVWDDIQTDSKLVNITSCEDAVKILDKRNINNGKKMASDPFFNLATHLLAAQLNFGAGACTTPEIRAAALAAETLLDQVNFDGAGYDSPGKRSTLASEANSLATILDNYNNGMYCGSTMP